MPTRNLRNDARTIWDAAVAAADPVECVRGAARHLIAAGSARRIIVVGGGKAGTAMAAGLETVLADRLTDISGLINIPAGTERPLAAIRLNVARPAGTNEPTAAGVAGVRAMMDLVRHASADDWVIALVSGGGSALMPLPAPGVSIEDKQTVTRLLHRSGATIAEMNCVRKHLSDFKGGGLAAAAPCPLVALIISDVIGDPLDAIASGPTAADPTTFADAVTILRAYRLWDAVPAGVRACLEDGLSGRRRETLKSLPPGVQNVICSNNAQSLQAATLKAQELGYRVVNMGAFVEGETADVARAMAGVARSIAVDGQPVAPPACILIGGETTVTLPPDHGRGGRNTEFVLAALRALDRSGMSEIAVLSGGTDGEDGPTDAAGAVGDSATLRAAADAGFDSAESLRRHDSYTFFDAAGGLIRTGLTQTNVMDVRVILVGRS